MAPRTKKPKPPLESAVMHAVQEHLRYRTDVVCWRSNTGAARLPAKGGKTRPVFFGLKGSADFTGLVVGSGVRIEIEVKRPGLGEQSFEQRCFGERIRAAGAIYLLVHSVDELREQLDEALQELRVLEGLSSEQIAAIRQARP